MRLKCPKPYPWTVPDLYVANSYDDHVLKIDRADAPSLHFDTTHIGSTSKDSARSQRPVQAPEFIEEVLARRENVQYVEQIILKRSVFPCQCFVPLVRETLYRKRLHASLNLWGQ